MTPNESVHVRQSELCATCHTLFTTALDAGGRAVGRLPEQVPFLEWQHSAYNTERSCQDCHMPPVAEPTPIASVLGQPREGLTRHTFLGGNVFMLRMLNRYRNELGVTAPPHELEAAAMATERQLRAETATLRIADERRTGSSVTFTVIVENLTGHKLPTGYPSRRVEGAGHGHARGGAQIPDHLFPVGAQPRNLRSSRDEALHPLLRLHGAGIIARDRARRGDDRVTAETAVRGTTPVRPILRKIRWPTRRMGRNVVHQSRQLSQQVVTSLCHLAYLNQSARTPVHGISE
jgi:hypothetical protein